MDQRDLERKTREVFHGIHVAQGCDQNIFDRISNLLSQEYLRVSSGFFMDKVCLDAGCGSNAYKTYKMLQMGAKRVYAFDLDKTIFESAEKNLREFNGRYELAVGNVLNMEYNDNSFDFTHCAGVLHHSRDVFKGLGELARVTKPGGTLYIETCGKGGFVREINSMLRVKYAKDDEFKSLIDNLENTDLLKMVKWFFSIMEEHGDDIGKEIPWLWVEKLLDKDLVLTIKDRIMAPSLTENSEEELVDWFNENGFRKVERLTRYPKLENIRRLLSPVYFKYDSKLARFLYGSGSVQLKAIKDK